MYGKINGKQIKDTSLDLLKLDLTGNQGTFLYGTGSYLGSYELSPSSPYAFITKQYADSLAAGLDPKGSVYLVAVNNISPSGTVSIDGVTASLGKRVLLTSQTNSVNNGIYVVGPTAWGRAADSDGDPSTEVSLGNYTFVERGSTYSSTGWILYDSSSLGSTVSVGVDTQLWTQFNGAGSFIWGDGLTNIGNTVNVDISPNGGLTFSSTQLTLAGYVSGNGLTLNSGILNVGAGTGITVGADIVSISNTGVSANTYGDAVTVPSITFNAQGQATGATATLIAIPSGQITNFTASVNSAISITAGQVTNFTSSVAGLVKSGPGITVTSGSNGATVSLAPLGSTSSYGSANTVNTFTYNNYGQITTAATLSIAIPSGQVTNFTASVQALASTVVAGPGISVAQSGGNATVSVVLSKGVTFSGGALFSDANTILTTANLSTILIGTNSTIQSALSAIDTALNGISAQQEISINNNPTGTFLKTVNAPFNMLGYTFSTASDGPPHIYINGVYVKTNSTTASSPAYFSTDSGVTGNTSVLANSVLYLNASILGFKVDPTDDIVVHYLSKYP